MIAFIEGTLESVTENSVIIDNKGIGYELLVPGSVFENLPHVGSEIKLRTYLQVKEDGIVLFGFANADELAVFKLLITVSGIGPKGALGILSSMSTDDLRFAVLSEDAKTIARAPGIGAKTAGKLILELKDKLKLADAFEKKLEHIQQGQAELPSMKNIQNEAVMALTSLGYSAAEATRAVRAVEITESMSVESLLGAALKFI